MDQPGSRLDHRLGLGLASAPLSSAAVLVAVLALGGGWHHYRWNELPADDLGWSERDAAARMAAWRGHGGARAEAERRIWPRRSPPGCDSHGRGDDRGHRRQPVATASDGPWSSSAGDRTDLCAGQPVEAAGQLCAGRRAAQSRRVRLPRLPSGPGDSPSAPVDEPGASRRSGRRRGPLTRRLGDLRTAAGAADRTARRPDRPLASALILGQREDIDPEVNDAFARTGTTHLLAISGLQLQVLAVRSGSGLPGDGSTPPARLRRCRTGHDRLRGTRRACPLGGPFGRHDVDLLRGRGRRTAPPGRPTRWPWPGSDAHPGTRSFSSTSAASSPSWPSAP